MWWQFLLVGVVAASVSLVVARCWPAGMTQPLRDMASAARRMETGDYSVRVHTRSRDEVGRLAAAFNRMSGELEHLEQSRRDLVANVSHELKTPITAIRAHLENLLDGVEQPEPATLEVMLAQVERLGRLVDQLLDLSRLESGEVPLRIEELPLQPLVDDLISEIDVALSGPRRARSTTHVPLDLPSLSADRERVHQVLFNLVDNAVRFTPDGGSVTVSARRRNGSVEVAVSDTGAGIPPEHLPQALRALLSRRSRARARGTAAPGSGSRSPVRSSRRTVVRSGPRANRATAASSPSTCPRPTGATDEVEHDDRHASLRRSGTPSSTSPTSSAARSRTPGSRRAWPSRSAPTRPAPC